MADTSATALDFTSIDLVEIPVLLAGKEYVLREADAEAGAAYEDALIGSVVMQDGKPVTITNVNQRNLALLARCLFARADTQKGNKPVGLAFVNRLPRKVANLLVEKVKEISDIRDLGKGDDEDEETEGNSSGGTEPSSS